MGLPMFEQMIGKFYLSQIPTLNHKFTIANSFILIRQALDDKLWLRRRKLLKVATFVIFLL